MSGVLGIYGRICIVPQFIKQFTAEVDAFKELEPTVRQAIANSIHVAANGAAKLITEKIESTVTQAVEKTAQRLSYAVEKAERSLGHYQQEHRYNHWITITVGFFAAIITSLLIVWLVMPTPVLPLTSQQIKYLREGPATALVWPNLPKQEQHYLLSELHKVDHQLK